MPTTSVRAVSGHWLDIIPRIITHLRTPLYRNGYALILSSVATSALGMVYWVLAARSYATDAIGLNSAAISAMMFLAGAAQLNLISALIRFIPCAGRVTRPLILWAYLVSVTVAAVVGLIFILGLDRWAPTLGFLSSSPARILWFTVATMTWCIFVLQASVLTGLRETVWVPGSNLIFALGKIILLVSFAGPFPEYGVFASWTVAVGLSVLPTSYLIFRRLIPKHVGVTQDRAEPVVPAQIVRFVAADYLGALCWLASTTLLPIIVTQEAGAAANAYFYLPWLIAFPLYGVSPSMGSSLIVEAASDRAALVAYSRRVIYQTALLVVPAAAILVLGAPYILQIFGDNYASEGVQLLRLLALSAIPHLINSLYVSIARVTRDMTGIVISLASFCALALTLSYVLLPIYGITGVGVGWLVAQILVAAFLLLTRFRPLWSSNLDHRWLKDY